jgi:hypothetical protein
MVVPELVALAVRCSGISGIVLISIARVISIEIMRVVLVFMVSLL